MMVFRRMKKNFKSRKEAPFETLREKTFGCKEVYHANTVVSPYHAHCLHNGERWFRGLVIHPVALGALGSIPL